MKKPSKTPGKPKKPAQTGSDSQSSRSDLILKGAAVLLAGGAVAFPWYVFFNQDKFGVSVAGWEQLRDVRGFRHDGGEMMPVETARGSNRNGAAGGNGDGDGGLDQLTTATVASPVLRKREGEGADLDQPMPGGAGFRLLHVANGRAMIEDRSGVYIVQQGSVLPDNSRLASIEQRDGKWTIVTSNGRFYESGK
ncbi:MAG: flagellar protein [Neorhizobium sp.]|nr:flagellar protein [Neorhizobium sp.]